ncbi:MAG: universal stress protein [Halobacteriota archaeon]
MVVLIPFDGSTLSRTALKHGSHAANLYEESILAVSVIPDRNATYAREHDWITGDEAFEIETIVSRLRRQVAQIAPEAEFKHIVVDRYAPSGTIANHIRRLARNLDVSAIFIGSQNAARSVLGTKSVGGQVAYEDDYDIVIIRNPMPEPESSSPVS